VAFSRPTHQRVTPAVGQRHEDFKREFIVDYIKNHKVGFLLIGIALLTILRITIAFSSGYFGRFYILSPLCTETFRYIFIIISVVVLVASKLDQKQKTLLLIAEVFLIAIGLIPTGHFMTLGALFSIQNTDPEQIRNDARLLLDEYEPETLFSDYKNQRPPFDNPTPKNELPPTLQNDNFGEVLVLEDYVFIEKFGATALLRGFIVFREGADIWKNEEEITLLAGCSYCWKVRIIDGLYWYHDVPRDEEIPTFVLPLK
jgi:hypothetical protein